MASIAESLEQLQGYLGDAAGRTSDESEIGRYVWQAMELLNAPTEKIRKMAVEAKHAHPETGEESALKERIRTLQARWDEVNNEGITVRHPIDCKLDIRSAREHHAAGRLTLCRTALDRAERQIKDGEAAVKIRADLRLRSHPAWR